MPLDIHPQRERQIAGLIVGAYVLLALIFSTGPIFEGPDEIEHYRYVRTLVSTHALPDPAGQFRGEYHQAPLYYLLFAPVALLAPDRDFAQIDGHVNPFYGSMIHIASNDNKNLYLHTQAESFPYRHSGTALAVHLMRLVSVALGAGTVLASYAIFRLLWPNRPDRRILALGVVAFWPQFLYLSSVVSNDNLLNFLVTVALWLLLRQVRDGPSPRRAIGLGIVLGALLLTKSSALVVVLPVGLAFLLDRRAWRFAPLVLALTLAVAGWWYVRNAVRDGDPTGTAAMFRTWQSEMIRPHHLALDIGLKRVPFAYRTLWARFGQGAVAVTGPLYALFDGLVAVVVAGAAVSLLRVGLTVLRRGRVLVSRLAAQQAVLVGLFTAIWIGALFYAASIAWSGNQGRYLLPGIAGWGALAAFGLDTWTPRRVRVPVALLSVAGLASIAAVCLFGYFLPSYRVSPVPDSIAQPLLYRYEDAAELIGMSPAAPKAWPGETITVTLYWRALQPSDMRLQAYLHTTDSDLVRRDSLPGTGNLLASDWKPGQQWAERYIVQIPDSAPPQTVHALVAGLYDPVEGRTLAASDASGQPVTPWIGRLAIRGPRAHIAPDYRFGEVIGLVEPQLSRDGSRLGVCLRWVSLAETPVDYTVFVHVLGDDGSPIAQADAPPRDGAYPTGAWSPGEVIDDCITLDVPDLPPHGWSALVGLYNLADFTRLPVSDRAGRALPDQAVTLSPP
jgi:hypothetical protein